MESNGQERNFMKDRKFESSSVTEGKVFFDTNILVYSVDERTPEKKVIASNLLNEASRSKNGIISTQSLQEFYNAAVKKLNLSKQAAKEYVDFFSKQFPVKEISIPLIIKAIDISIKNGLSFWDSLILSTANDTGCILVYSEDMNSGQIICGTKVLNPF